MIKSWLKRINNREGAQDGVTLLLAVLLMSGVLIITITVAFFVVQEVRNSRSSTLTEPAIIAAESAGEQGIYTIKRGTFSSDCSSAPYTNLDGSPSGTTNTRIKKCVAFVPAVIEIKPTPPLELYLYDPNDVNGNTCLELSACNADTGLGSGGQLYSAINIKHLNGGSVMISVVTLDGVPVYNGLITSSSSFPPITILPNILGSKDERLKMTLRPTTVTTTLEISTSGILGGLPDYRTIDAQGCSATLQISNCESNPEIYNRRIQITVPAPQ